MPKCFFRRGVVSRFLSRGQLRIAVAEPLFLMKMPNYLNSTIICLSICATERKSTAGDQNLGSRALRGRQLETWGSGTSRWPPEDNSPSRPHCTVAGKFCGSDSPRMTDRQTQEASKQHRPEGIFQFTPAAFFVQAKRTGFSPQPTHPHTKLFENTLMPAHPPACPLTTFFEVPPAMTRAHSSSPTHR